MNPVYYYILHVFALLVLTAQTFAAFANPAPENRKRTMITSGIASLLMIVAGFGLISKVYANHFAGWMFVKMACWLVITAVSGIAYRKPELRGKLVVIAFAALLIALVMVYAKPF
ncbi:MAG: SirB2 family protein [Verrucomicrobia bacterium]|nr:SirB2 family protein [Verrucomicrobiota bacterium]